MIRLGNRER